MRKLIPILVLLLLAMDARAQSISRNYPAAGAVSAGQLVTINSGGAVAPVAAGSIAGVIGVALQGVALPGQTVSIGTNGNFPVSVDNSPSCIPGNQMNISATFAGEATCGSTPSGTQEVGVVASVVSGVVRAAFNISASASQSNVGVSSVSGTAPITSSGGTTPVIGCATCNTSSGGTAFPIVTKTTTYSALSTDVAILCNGTFTTTLPISSIIVGQFYRIKNIGTGVCTVSAGGSVNIDNATTAVISIRYNSIDVQWDGTQYWIF